MIVGSVCGVWPIWPLEKTRADVNACYRGNILMLGGRFTVARMPCLRPPPHLI